MEIYKKIIFDSNEDDEQHKLSFTNTISFETLTNAEKSFRKYPMTPINKKPYKTHLLLKRSPINKEILSDIDSTGNTSEKKLNGMFNIRVEKKNINNRYKDIKESNKNLNAPNIETTQNLQIRRDIYGSEIKKGGNHHISFADNALIIKKRMKLEENNNMKSEEMHNYYNSDKKIKRICLKQNIIDIKNLKKLKKSNIDNTNKTKRSLVEVVEIQNYKELNKTDYFYNPDDEEKKEQQQEAVCCSSICFIY